MKKLTKIKLINWHSYINTSIDIKNNTIICGENGSGKSTLLDAVNYVISCGTCKFNTAANERNDRNVESYVRGKLSYENKKYLREGDVISHIALEFFDDSTNTYMIVGTVISCSVGSKLDKRFYMIDKATIDDSKFIKNNNGKTVAVTSGELRSNYQKIGKEYFEFDKTTEQNKLNLLSSLGLEQIEAKKYLELLPKALAFKPISDVNKFVYDYLLPEKTLALDNMKESVRRLRDIKGTIEFEENKLDGLQNIYDLEPRYNNYKSENDKLNSLLLDREYSLLKAKLDKNTREKELVSKNINELNVKSENILKSIESLKEELNTLKNHEEDKTLLSLQDKKEKANNELNLYKTKNNENKGKLEELSVYLNNLNISNSIKASYYKEDYSLFNAELLEVKEKVNEKYENTIEELHDLNKDYNELNKKLDYLNNAISKLEKGINNYPSYALNLKDALEEYFKNKYNKDIKVSVFSDLVKNVDEEWRNALEGFLNTRRFYLFIDKEYYDEALRVYNQIGKEGRIDVYTAGLVATNTLKEVNENDINKNSLFTKLEFESEYVKRYAFTILNNVICVDSVDDLKKFDIAITKDCMLYQGHVSRLINPKVYKLPYLGREALTSQIKVLNEDRNKVIEIKNQFIESLKIININKDYLTRSNNIIQEIELKEDIFARINSLQNDIMVINDEMSKLNNLDFIKNQELIESKENKLNELNNEEKEIRNDLINKNSSLINYENTILDLKEKLSHEEYLKNINIDSFNKLKDLYKDKTNEDIELDIKNNNDLLIGFKKDIESSMRNYVSNIDRKCGLEPVIDNLNSFLSIYNGIKDREIIKYKEKAYKAQEEADTAFKNDYLVKIRDFINEERENVRKLNNILKDPKNKFGQELETYEFVISGTDDSKLKPYYELIESNEEFNVNSLFVSSISKTNRDLMDDLFARITSDDDKENEKELSKFLDYRNFLKYDIKIIDRHNNISYYSKGGKGKSGGETQTPFYVFIAASFNQICSKIKVKNTPICLMFLDEAFNNMDESRIESMMNFYSKLNIQLLISVPTQRAPSMLNYVDTALGVIKDNNNTTVFNMKKI